MNAARLSRLRQLRSEIDALIAEEETAEDQPAPPPAPTMSLEDFAQREQVSLATVSRWVKRGLPVRRRGGVVRVIIDEADRWTFAKSTERSAERAAARGNR